MDLKRSDGPSNALWIPLIWMFLAGSRYVSSWINLGAPMRSVDAYLEGSPIDRVIFSVLIVAGVFVLSQRKLDWGRMFMRNKWILLYFVYCGISFFWSDYPFVSFKRWIKDLGNPIMVLVILTEERPYEAIGVIIKRLAFLWLPLSVLLIKYYPELGRAYHQGRPMFTGVADQKNSLGLICLISGSYFVWNFILNRKGDFKFGVWGKISDFIFIGMVVWLLHMAQSATSLACLVVVTILLLVARLKVIARKPDRIILLIIVVAIIFPVLDWTLDVTDIVVRLLGRTLDLTSRVPLWEGLKEIDTNPVVGAGFMSFWSGPRMEMIWEKYGKINQAHNGYLELYLNLGYLGIVLMGAIMLSGLIKVRRHLNLDYPSAVLRLCFIVSAALYNYSEASLYGMSNVWLLLLVAAIEIPDQLGSKIRVGVHRYR
jgi:O-antigen ligase